MNFRKTSEWGGGSFPIRKISLRFFRKFWGGKNNEFSEKGGGSRQSEWISLQIFGPPEKSATLFSENRVGWGGSEAVWKFSENSLNLVQVVIPYCAIHSFLGSKFEEEDHPDWGSEESNIHIIREREGRQSGSRNKFGGRIGHIEGGVSEKSGHKRDSVGQGSRRIQFWQVGSCQWCSWYKTFQTQASSWTA